MANVQSDSFIAHFWILISKLNGWLNANGHWHLCSSLKRLKLDSFKGFFWNELSKWPSNVYLHFMQGQVLLWL